MVTGWTHAHAAVRVFIWALLRLPLRPRFIFLFTTSEEQEADGYCPFPHMSKVVLSILKARQKPHPELRSGPPSEDS